MFFCPSCDGLVARNISSFGYDARSDFLLCEMLKAPLKNSEILEIVIAELLDDDGILFRFSTRYYCIAAAVANLYFRNFFQLLVDFSFDFDLIAKKHNFTNKMHAD